MNKSEKKIVKAFKLEVLNKITEYRHFDHDISELVNSLIETQLEEFKDDGSVILSYSTQSIGIERKLIQYQIHDVLILRYTATTTKRVYRNWEIGMFVMPLQ
ncbi:hypothetical protein V4100_000984 [Pseudomonas aeruginosa]